MTAVKPDAAELDALLHSAGLGCTATAAHGVLAGCLVADPSLPVTRLAEALGERHPGPGFDDTVFHDAVERLRLDVLRALNDADLGFEPLLTDADDLSLRTLSLGLWVDGFLGGLGQTPRLGGLKPSAEAAEILRDFAEIARIDPEPEDCEESEEALAELSEYVRVGVMLLADELAPEQHRQPIPLQ
jgi:uncharacterized protein